MLSHEDLRIALFCTLICPIFAVKNNLWDSGISHLEAHESEVKTEFDSRFPRIVPILFRSRYSLNWLRCSRPRLPSRPTWDSLGFRKRYPAILFEAIALPSTLPMHHETVNYTLVNGFSGIGISSETMLCDLDLGFSAIGPWLLCPSCHVSTRPSRIWQIEQYFNNMYRVERKHWCQVAGKARE